MNSNIATSAALQAAKTPRPDSFGSCFGMDEHVWVRYQERAHEAVSGRVVAVTFTNYGKVLYDVAIDSDGPAPTATFERIDAAFVEPCVSEVFANPGSN